MHEYVTTNGTYKQILFDGDECYFELEDGYGWRPQLSLSYIEHGDDWHGDHETSHSIGKDELKHLITWLQSALKVMEDYENV